MDNSLNETQLETFKEILLNYVCPGIGVILANALFFAPMNSLKSALKGGNLGELNPVPWGFMIGNCAGWLAYAFLTLDLFVFFANAPGFILSLWLNFGAIKLQYIDTYEESALSYIDGWENPNDENSRFLDESINSDDMGKIQTQLQSLTSHEIIVISVSTFWVVVFTLITFIPMAHDDKLLTIGTIVNLNLIIFYGAPLSTIYTVIKTRNSSSIHNKLMITSTLNSIFWVIYGVAVFDFFIIIPNSMGIVFGVIQMLLLKWYPKDFNINAALRRTTIMRATLKYNGASPEKRKTILEYNSASVEKRKTILEYHSSSKRKKTIRFKG